MNESFSILVIDDEPVIRDSCLQILSRKGCEVFLSEDGGKGLDRFNERVFDLRNRNRLDFFGSNGFKSHSLDCGNCQHCNEREQLLVFGQNSSKNEQG